jgi:hypothetical protein
MTGGVVSDVQPDKKEWLLLVIEFGITGGVVSDVQPDKNS